MCVDPPVFVRQLNAKNTLTCTKLVCHQCRQLWLLSILHIACQFMGLGEEYLSANFFGVKSTNRIYLTPHLWFKDSSWMPSSSPHYEEKKERSSSYLDTRLLEVAQTQQDFRKCLLSLRPDLQPNLALSSCAWLPPWLHHKKIFKNLILLGSSIMLQPKVSPKMQTCKVGVSKDSNGDLSKRGKRANLCPKPLTSLINKNQSKKWAGNLKEHLAQKRPPKQQICLNMEAA